MTFTSPNNFEYFIVMIFCIALGGLSAYAVYMVDVVIEAKILIWSCIVISFGGLFFASVYAFIINLSVNDKQTKPKQRGKKSK